MPKRTSLPNKLKRPPKVGTSSWGKKIISADIASTPEPSVTEINAKKPPSSSNPGPSHVIPENRKEPTKGKSKRHKSNNDFDGALTDKLIDTIRSGDQYPQRVANSMTTTKNVQFTSTTKEAKKGSKSGDEQWDWNQPGTKESMEILQGISKIKLEDWFPFYDFHHLKRRQMHQETADTPAEKSSTETVDDDEWEETLVYVDLEDVPEAENLFLSNPASGSVDDKEDENNEVVTETEVKIFNLDTELPVLLIGGKYLSGHWEDSTGTSLFFQKKNQDDDIYEDDEGMDTNSNPSSHTPNPKGNLKSIVPDPEIPFDPLFGESLGAKEDGYKLVAKSMKVLRTKCFPVVNEELKGEDVIKDADNEFDPRDFQIPPASMLRQFYGPEINYESFVDRDIERRRKIRERWLPEKEKNQENVPFIKPEPIDQPDFEETDYFDCDSPSIIDEDDDEVPGTSKTRQS